MQLQNIFSTLLFTLATSSTAAPVANSIDTTIHHGVNFNDAAVALEAFHHARETGALKTRTAGQCGLHVHQYPDSNGNTVTDATLYDGNQNVMGTATGPSSLDTDFIVKGLPFNLLIETLDTKFYTITYGNDVHFQSDSSSCQMGGVCGNCRSQTQDGDCGFAC